MELSTVFKSRPYFDSVANREYPFHIVVKSNLHKFICNSLEIFQMPSYEITGVIDSRFSPRTGVLIVNSTETVRVAASHNFVDTTLRAAVFALYYAYIEMLWHQLHGLVSDEELRKFGFTDNNERDEELDSLTEIRQDLLLLVKENLGGFFTDQECDDILAILD